MNALFKALNGLFQAAPHPQDRDDVYLAESTDLYDLERRMRQIENRNRSLTTSGPYGVFMR